MNMRSLFPLGLFLLPTAALAHIKWFEAYEVSAEPVPIREILSLPYFWLGMGLVLAFFIATTLIERTRAGVVALEGLDKVADPLRRNADRFLVALLAAFFVALFAAGGTYLTPELRTDAPLVPWVQLGIAILIVFRRTRALAGVAIVVLWVVTLRDYDLFHLLDYLALGLGIAGYLLLGGLPEGRWHSRRFAVLRWGVALALMWSSMEKLMYPQWFLPLLEERPFLAFGIPFGPYTTMAGVAEFTLGFGLLWTPLVRRLSAVALFALMFAAVYPFGRVDLVGHATILAALLVIIADPERENTLALVKASRLATLVVPAGLAVALAITLISYSGMHHLIYDRASGQLAMLLRPQTLGPSPRAAAAPGAFWRNTSHYHGAGAAAERGATATMMAAMDDMQEAMNKAQVTGNIDRDFAALIAPHHDAAIEMARTYLENGRDPELRAMARGILETRTAEASTLSHAGDRRHDDNGPDHVHGAQVSPSMP